jgi:head-tail adaptor
MGVTASKLDRRLTVVRSELVDDGFGVVQGPWEPVGTVPASRKDISDGEKWRAGEIAASVSTRFQVRSSTFSRAIKPQDRVICEGETFEIVGTKQAGGRFDLIEITASRRTDGTP